MTAWPETTDDLGRVIPGRTVDELTRSSNSWTPVHVAQILQRIHGPDAQEARRAIVDRAASLGITHAPPDLAGRRYRFAS